MLVLHVDNFEVVLEYKCYISCLLNSAHRVMVGTPAAAGRAYFNLGGADL